MLDRILDPAWNAVRGNPLYVSDCNSWCEYFVEMIYTHCAF